MKLINVLRLLLRLAPDGEFAEVLERVIAYMELVDRALELVLQIAPKDERALEDERPEWRELLQLVHKARSEA